MPSRKTGVKPFQGTLDHHHRPFFGTQSVFRRGKPAKSC